MCDADVGVLTYYWNEKVSTPRANFNTQHKCRDFEAVLEWSHKKAAKDPLGEKLTKTQGVVQYTAPPLVSMRGSQWSTCGRCGQKERMNLVGHYNELD